MNTLRCDDAPIPQSQLPMAIHASPAAEVRSASVPGIYRQIKNGVVHFSGLTPRGFWVPPVPVLGEHFTEEEVMEHVGKLMIQAEDDARAFEEAALSRLGVVDAAVAPPRSLCLVGPASPPPPTSGPTRGSLSSRLAKLRAEAPHRTPATQS